MQLGGPAGDDGSIDVDHHPGAARGPAAGRGHQFHRGDLRIRREERWEPITDGSATATVTGSILDSPASLTGTAVLEPWPESGGARLKLRATVEVRIPLVGGKLENFIGNQLVELLIHEQRFTTTWIGETSVGRTGYAPAFGGVDGAVQQFADDPLEHRRQQPINPGSFGVDRRCQLTSVPVPAARSVTVPTWSRTGAPETIL